MVGISIALFARALESRRYERQHHRRDQTGTGDEAGGASVRPRTVNGKVADSWTDELNGERHCAGVKGMCGWMDGWILSWVCRKLEREVAPFQEKTIHGLVAKIGLCRDTESKGIIR